MSTTHDPTHPSATPVEDGRVNHAVGESSLQRRIYAKPALECLGAWRALTLQQSVPIGMFRLPTGDRVRDVETFNGPAA